MQLSQPTVSCELLLPQDFCGGKPLHGELTSKSLTNMAWPVHEAIGPWEDNARLIRTTHAYKTEEIHIGELGLRWLSKSCN